MFSETTKPRRKRPYELRKRAENMEATRQRITEAAVDLHGTVGPSRTTISAVAERAGVQRHTVYRHFPTEEALFAACSGHWAEQNPFPDVAAWSEVTDPGERLARGLGELYGWYERTEPMLSNLYRDEALVESVAKEFGELRAYFDEAATALANGWKARGRRARVVAAAARHAVDFHTWRSLARDGGLTRAQAVELAAAMVERAAHGEP